MSLSVSWNNLLKLCFTGLFFCFQGEVKQSRWVEQVERAISNVTDRELKGLLQQIEGFANIPRKEAKFINFLQNSIRIRDRELCLRVCFFSCLGSETSLP